VVSCPSPQETKAMAELKKLAEGSVPPVRTDWEKVAELRRATEQAIKEAREAASRLNRALNRGTS
jgi:hypothetical protein